MKIAHIADTHVTEGLAFESTLNCLQFCFQDGLKHGVELWLLAGDFTGTTVPHRATPAERNALAGAIQAMANHAPVVMIYGNHDAPTDLDIYGKLKARHLITVVNQPGIYCPVREARVYCLPYPSKRWLLANGETLGGIENQKQAVEAGLRQILTAWRLDALTHPSHPKMMLGHLNIGGSALGGGEVLIGQEVELAPHDLDELGMDYIALGHIHLHQRIAEKAWYSGSPDRGNFGETDEKGYCLVDVRPGLPPTVERRLTPARRLVTIAGRWSPTTGWVVPDVDVTGAEVRLKIEVSEEHAATCPMDELVKRVQGEGSLAVTIDRRIIPTTRVRSEAISTALTTTDKVLAFWGSLGRSGPSKDQCERCLAKLPELEVTWDGDARPGEDASDGAGDEVRAADGPTGGSAGPAAGVVPEAA